MIRSYRRGNGLSANRPSGVWWLVAAFVMAGPAEERELTSDDEIFNSPLSDVNPLMRQVLWMPCARIPMGRRSTGVSRWMGDRRTMPLFVHPITVPIAHAPV